MQDIFFTYLQTRNRSVASICSQHVFLLVDYHLWRHSLRGPRLLRADVSYGQSVEDSCAVEKHRNSVAIDSKSMHPVACRSQG
jgi:hypothetical protein